MRLLTPFLCAAFPRHTAIGTVAPISSDSPVQSGWCWCSVASGIPSTCTLLGFLHHAAPRVAAGQTHCSPVCGRGRCDERASGVYSGLRVCTLSSAPFPLPHAHAHAYVHAHARTCSHVPVLLTPGVACITATTLAVAPSTASPPPCTPVLVYSVLMCI